KKNDPEKSRELKRLKAELSSTTAPLRVAEKEARESPLIKDLNQQEKIELNSFCVSFGEERGLGADTKAQALLQAKKAKHFKAFRGEGVITIRERTTNRVPTVAKVMSNQ